jgi:hypothetical protein
MEWILFSLCEYHWILMWINNREIKKLYNRKQYKRTGKNKDISQFKLCELGTYWKYSGWILKYKNRVTTFFITIILYS